MTFHDGARLATTAVVAAALHEAVVLSAPPMNAPTRVAGETLDAATLWRHLQRLVERVTAALEGETVVDDSLDIVVELLGADRGLVLLEQENGTTLAINARGPRRALDPAEREEMSRTIIRRAMDSDEVVVWNAAEQPLDSASVLALGIHGAMAAPLRARGLPRGVLYVDFRGGKLSVDAAQREFFMAAVAVLGGMIDQASVTRVARDRLSAAQSHVTEARRTPPLDSLLRAPGMRRVRADVELALAGDSPVLVLGESGTGKTLVAQAIAEASRRTPIVRIVLGGSDDLNTITSELFGHERGSFSGATTKRIGLVEYAHGGTLLLDEILNLPPHAQKLLLDFTQFGTYRPLGYDKAEPKRAAVRLVAATNGDMKGAIREGRFREDLYYRLAGITIRLPPLRDRREDVPALAESSIRSADPSREWTLSLELRRHLASLSYGWPGNVRELEWTIRRARDRAVVRDPSAKEIELDDFGETGGAESVRGADVLGALAGSGPDAWQQLQELKEKLDEREVEILRGALARHDGVVAHAAKELGIARTTLAGRVEALGLARK
jgi:transcriptional regulator with GAF, ATPase, and Fis domain